ncbi:MAG TPA: methylenetetrahydrofolate reductase, partial [Pseudomonadales bacterium]|nr:methylenetetrahydrofolate reductase [Pseudomonadales bacterium]
LNELAYASDLVRFIRETTGDHFHLEVAAYPEMHPQAPNARQDLLNFKQKVDAGANSAITQFFFNIDAYFYFVEACEKEGITIPIIPGIMPIINFANLQRFAGNCGAEIPRWLAKKMETYSDQKSQFEFGIEFITHFCEELLAQGAPGLHFYTMNQVEPNKTIWENLGLTN